VKRIKIRYVSIPSAASGPYECADYNEWVRRALGMLGWRGRMSKGKRRIVRTICEEKANIVRRQIFDRGWLPDYPGCTDIADEYAVCAMHFDEVRIHTQPARASA
jgi:hypothetical protein